MKTNRHLHLDRRQLLASAGGAIAITATPLKAFAAQEDLERARTDLFGNRVIQDGRVTLKLPPIAENGFSVPLDISVDSPKTPDDYVQRVAILSPRNPLPLIGVFHLSPHAGLARVSTRIRMSGTQEIEAVAEMNDGSLWAGRMETVVTLAACVVL